MLGEGDAGGGGRKASRCDRPYSPIGGCWGGAGWYWWENAGWPRGVCRYEILVGFALKCKGFLMRNQWGYWWGVVRVAYWEALF